jgi:cellulose synthase/poly-beta-1,6-N-acetylglucosamine synthase-like glycosyltransferase
MKVSVLVPTWCRPEALARCLDALERQARLPDELILSIRDNDAETLAMLAERRLPFSMHVAIPTGSGVIAALNAGLDQVEGEVVAITDDDAVPHPDWLQRIEAYFRDDVTLGGLGGRDRIIEHGLEVKVASPPIVGSVLWFGRIVGNHHLGSGPPREVDILKGANMALRWEAVAGRRLDTAMRGRGVEDHWEIDLSLGLQASGWKLVYDPAVVVDHYREARFGSQRAELASAQDRYDTTHNEAYVLLKHLSGLRRVVTVGYGLIVGTRENPGPLLALERLLSGRPVGEVSGRLRTASSARLGAFRTWWRWRRSTR